MTFSFKSAGSKTRPDREKPPVSTSNSPATPPRYRRDSDSSIDSFASAKSRHDNASNDAVVVNFSPEQEVEMLSASNSLKTSANKQYMGKDYSSAISTYDKALAELPNYLNYEIAVLQSNIAACYLQLREWKEAIEAAEKGLDGLEREWPIPKPKQEREQKQTDKQDKAQRDAQSKKQNNHELNTNEEDKEDEEKKIVELPDDTTEEDATKILENLQLSDQRKTDITRIRAKLLLRRAKAKVSICDEPPPSSAANPTATTIVDETDHDQPDPRRKPALLTTSHWSNLSSALEDYTLLSRPPFLPLLPTSDKTTVLTALRILPPRIEQAKKREMDEMLSKLKDLGNMVLKPFGLSTDMFQMKQDPVSGGWSMGVNTGEGKTEK